MYRYMTLMKVATFNGFSRLLNRRVLQVFDCRPNGDSGLVTVVEAAGK